MNKQHPVSEPRVDKKPAVHNEAVAATPDAAPQGVNDPLAFEGGAVQSQASTLQRLPAINRKSAMQQINRLQGNHHAQQIASVARGSLQAKLSVSQVGDPAEVEADQMARQVMSLEAASVQRQATGVIHRSPAAAALQSDRFAGNATLEAVLANKSKLQRGSKGEAVRLVQEALMELGYALPKYGADGSFGGEMESAVKQFQSEEGLGDDGVVGTGTLGRLDAKGARSQASYDRIGEAQVKTAVLNVRQEASTGAKVLGQLKNGETVTVTGKEGAWLRIDYQGKAAYVHGDYTTFAADPEAPKAIGTAQVTASVLNIRQEPSTEAGVLGQLKNGESLSVAGQEGEWLKIVYQGRAAYVYASYTSYKAPEPEKPKVPTVIGTGYVSADLLNVRKGPAADAEKLGQLSNGAEVQIVARGTPWLTILYQGQTAYVHGDFVSATAKPEPKTDDQPAGNGGETPATGGANSLLFDLETTGASKATAGQDGIKEGGVGASEKLAKTDKSRVAAYAKIFIKLGSEKGLPPALLAAIASRESRGGNILDANGFGDHGNGFGLMQVDKRYHDISGGAYSEDHIRQAAGILADYFEQVQKNFPNWTRAQQLRGAVAAYNSGVGNVKTLERMDVGTTGNDYSADVWARARYYASFPEFGGSEAISGNAPALPKPEENKDNPQAPTAQETVIGEAEVTTAVLNVRVGPSTDQKKLGELTQGARVQVTGREGEWLRIVYEGQGAYIHSNYAAYPAPKKEESGTAPESGGSEQQEISGLDSRIGARIKAFMANFFIKIKVGEKGGQPVYVSVRTPYHMNAGSRKTNAEANRSASAADNKVINNNADWLDQHGKADPEGLRKTVQAAVDEGRIKAAGETLTADEIRGWMLKYGIGVDCSGFVSQALNDVTGEMAREAGVSAPKSFDVGNTGADALNWRDNPTKFTQVAHPSALKAGDTMWMPGDVSHIIIITSVQKTDQGVKFTTAESSASGTSLGVHDDTYRCANPDGDFSDLQRLVGGEWQARNSDGNFLFSRYKALAAFKEKAADEGGKQEGEKTQPETKPETKPETQPETPKVLGIGRIATKSDPLNLRSAPESGDNVLDRIPRKTEVQVIGESGDWLKVIYNGQTGYLARQYVQYPAQAQVESERELSGAQWYSRFMPVASIDNLVDPFKSNVRRFVAAMEEAGASVDISATRRPPQRAYLMHYAFSIATQGMDPTTVPDYDGDGEAVNIEWVHRDAGGNVDLAASRRAAQEMCNKYSIAYMPSLTSHHIKGIAIDMSISWTGTLKVKNADGDVVSVTGSPRNGFNSQLIAVGATYSVIKFYDHSADEPHWSADGH